MGKGITNTDESAMAQVRSSAVVDIEDYSSFQDQDGYKGDEQDENDCQRHTSGVTQPQKDEITQDVLSRLQET